MSRLIPLSPCLPIVTAEELAGFLSYDNPADPTLAALCVSATEAIEELLGYSLLTRQWRAIYAVQPLLGTPLKGLWGGDFTPENPLVLRMSAAICTLDQALFWGEDLTVKCVVLQGLPSRLKIPIALQHDRDQNAYDLKYTTAYAADISGIPAPIKQAVLAYAGALFDTRGCPDAGDLIQKAGIAAQIDRYRLERLVIR